MDQDDTTIIEVLSVALATGQGMRNLTNMASEPLATCKYCGKTFRQEKTLAAHLCERKRRAQQEKDTGVQLGFQAYLKFYEMTQGSAQSKTYTHFADSPYYSAFVKFGQYLVSIRVVNASAFMTWIIKSNKKLDHWTKEAFYDEWLFDYLRKEHPNDALDRSFSEMQRWADDSGKPFNVFFTECSPNKICNMLINGRISTWVLLNSAGGIAFLSRLNEEQIALIYKNIDPPFWERKLLDYVADSEFIKLVCSEAAI